MQIDPKREQRRSALIAELRGSVAEVLQRFPGISKIWIIGSVAKPLMFDMRSDMDIVVDGLPKENYFDLFRFLEGRMSSKIDLILLSDITEEDKSILDKKVVIYEKTVV